MVTLKNTTSKSRFSTAVWHPRFTVVYRGWL